MNDLRGILALLALAAGVILLAAAARYAFAKKSSSVLRRKRVTTTVVYAVLFLAVGGLLWSRQGQTDLTSPQADKPTGRQTETPADGQSQTDSVPPQTEKQVVPQVEPERTADVATEPPQEPRVDERAPARSGFQDVIRERFAAAEREAAAERARMAAEASSRAAGAPPKHAEERIEWYVNRAFTAIERFFEQHATPVASSPERMVVSKTTKPVRGEIRFPRVTFEEQTADLSPESAAGLKRLARDLMDRPGFNLEIQARVDSAGPEAFNFMLTQARAAAVRDYLVEEGVSAERLIARGFGSEPIPQANGQLIAFVVRR